MSSRVAIIIYLIAGQAKKISLYKISFIAEPYTPSKNQIKFEIDLSNYGTKFDLKNATDVDN